MRLSTHSLGISSRRAPAVVAAESRVADAAEGELVVREVHEAYVFAYRILSAEHPSCIARNLYQRLDVDWPRVAPLRDVLVLRAREAVRVRGARP